MATQRDDARTPEPPRPTFGEMVGEVIDLSAGVAVVLLPVLTLSVPAIVLFVVLPAVLLLALALPLAVIGAVIAAPPYLLTRWLRRRRRRTPSSPAGRRARASALRTPLMSGSSSGAPRRSRPAPTP